MVLFSTTAFVVHVPSSGARRRSQTSVLLASSGNGSNKNSPKDMSYIPYNIMRQEKNYNNIRAVGGVDTVNDVYVRDEDCDTFWFVGKVARCTGTVTLEQTITRQWNLIEEQGARLRPLELGPKYGRDKIQIWTAPPDTELDVAYHRPSVVFTRQTKLRPDYCVQEVKVDEIGFDGEVYDQGEEGFRTTRTEDGRPNRPEITGPDQP